ncbi:arsenite efflux transporter metallochaperone ArsD [Streptomyces enissocaesilis]|uniref:arsenite efflux transporter metallochaperone ArsD n=1 Tax=Streptomyces TaxID=1883 RepID=UPI0003D8540E|nr:arsenite efflux transporter metallochaperone ArsD [Streptomyces sp. F8]AHE39909.1 Arsenical resistance operon trans-acting repressor ArsD [Streptomyces sp. F8]WDI21718.1 arsenite efflux transporter metallochaperone ArsD [Streptomyces enissocaesilis]
MSAVEVYDPAMCCSTGVCGPSVDPALTQFAADVAWLGSEGVKVDRFGLSTDPGRFVEDSQVKALLQEKGDEALPAVLVDGAVRCSGRYPTRVELAEWTGVRTERPGLPMAAEADGGCGCGPEGC